MSDYVFEAFEKQQQYFESVRDPQYNYLLYGGAIRGGKTYVGLGTLFVLCKIFPGSRWAITRKDLPTLKRNTVPTFEKIKPRPFVGSINQTLWSVKCQNGSEILFFPESIKDDPELNRWRGLEVSGFLLEEANELQEATWFKAIERAGTWSTDHNIKPIILLTCNPSKGWVKRTFYDPWRSGRLKPPYYYLPARADDNPHISKEVRESWKNLPEAEYKRFVEGDWDYSDDPDQLIKFEWIRGAYEVEPIDGPQKIGVDVARFGDDDTVLSMIRGNTAKKMEGHHGLSVNAVAVHVRQKINEIPVNADNVNIDTVGLGAGVADILIADGYNVNEIVSGAKPVEQKDTTYTFKNYRSQMWWHVREMFRKGEIRLEINNPKLVEDLTAPKYKIDSDRMITVESKDDIKKRIGRSTDYGDSFVYAFAPKGEKKKAYSPRRR